MQLISCSLILVMFTVLSLQGADDCLCENIKPCQFHVNVVNRWDGSHPLIKPDTRLTEFWYHTPIAAKHPMKFTKIPKDRKVRILGFDLNAAARFTGRDGSRRRYWWASWVFGLGTLWKDRYPSGWAFIALHTGDHSGDQTVVDQAPSSDFTTGVSRDVLLWEQLPIAEVRYNYVRAWRDDSVINGLLPGGVLELKQGMFNWSGHETQVETTGEFFFCYQEM